MDNESGEFIEGDKEPGKGRSEFEVKKEEVNSRSKVKQSADE